MQSNPSSRCILLEVIVSSLDDARAAAAGGADRLELCSALPLGGLTPSLGLLATIKRESTLPVMFMIRPREAGMAYSEAELSVMQRDAELAMERGADGLVFAVLTKDGEVDESGCRRLLRIARQRAGCQAVFHRAFDVAADPVAALERIIDLGFTRVLTSGRARRAVDGLHQIRRTVEQSAGRIEVLAGGGITPQTVAKVVHASGVNQVHLSASRAAADLSTAANPAIRFGGDQPANETEFRETDEQTVREVREMLDDPDFL